MAAIIFFSDLFGFLFFILFSMCWKSKYIVSYLFFSLISSQLNVIFYLFWFYRLNVNVLMKCARKTVLNDRLRDGMPMILTYITMTMHVTILCNLRFCCIVWFNCFWYLRVLVLMPHFLQCCLLYHLVNIMFEFIKPYMFLFSRSLPQIHIKNGCKKNPSSSNSMH